MRLSVTNGFEGGEVYGLAWSPDARHLAVAHAGGREDGVSLFESESLRRGAHFEGAPGVGLAFSPDGRSLALGTAEGVLLIDPVTGSRHLLAALERVVAFAFDPTGALLVAGSRFGEVTLVEVATGLTHELPQPEEDLTLYSIAFSPDGTMVAAGLLDGRILRWRVEARSAVAPLVGHEDAVMSVAFSPDGSTLASAAFDGTVRLWNPATGELRAVLVSSQVSVIACVSWSPDGRQLLSTQARSATLWEVASTEVIEELTSMGVGSVAVSGLAQWSPNGRWLASRTGGGDVRVHDLETRASRTLGSQTSPAKAVAFDERGTTLWVGFAAGALLRWDRATGRVVERLAGDGEAVSSAATALDGAMLVVHSRGSALVTLDRRTGLRRVLASRAENDGVEAAAVSPQGRLLATTGPKGVLRVWDLESGSARLIGSQEKEPFCVAWSGDGRTIYTAADTLRAWSLATGEWSERPLGGSIASRLAASPTEPLLAVATSQGVILLRAPALEEVARLPAHDGSVVCLAFSPDGLSLAWGSAGGYLRVYSVLTGELHSSGRTHATSVEAVAYSPDGESIVTAEGDGTVREWDAHPLELRFALRAVEGGASYAFTEGADARAELFGDAARAWVQVADGHRRDPIDEASELLVQGLVGRARQR